MSIDITRRDFLTLALALVVAPGRAVGLEPAVRRSPYAMDVGLLYHVLSFHLEGTYEEHVDRAAGRYEVQSTGQGDRISNRFQSAGDSHAIANSSAPPSNASESHTGESASHTARRLAKDANRRNPRAVPADSDTA